MSLQDRKWNIEQCNRCHQCKVSPIPQSQRFSGICPSIDYGNFHSYSASGKLISAYAIQLGRAEFTEEVRNSITACSMCGVCDVACQTIMGDVVDPLTTIYELRAALASGGHLPAAHETLLDALRTHGNRFGKPPEDRAIWADGLGLADATRQRVGTLFHIGCDNAYDPERWAGLKWVVGILKSEGEDFGILFNEEKDAGGLAYELGDQELAKRLGERMIAQVHASGARTLLTSDAKALAAFRNYYVRLGLSLDFVRILHVSEYVREIAEAGRLALRTAREEVVTYHDPCRLGRLSEPFVPWNGRWTTVMKGLRVAEPPRPLRLGLGGVYDAPRHMLAQVEGVRMVEMERVRELSYCCGAGGGGKEAHPDFAEKAATSRLEEAIATGASTLVTACSECATHLSRVSAKAGLPIRVRELSDFLAEASV